MKTKEILLMANAAKLGHYIYDDKTVWRAFEKAYAFVQDDAVDKNYRGYEVVRGFINDGGYLEAISKDDTEFETTYPVRPMKPGEIAGDFLDKSGRMVFVEYPPSDG